MAGFKLVTAASFAAKRRLKPAFCIFITGFHYFIVNLADTTMGHDIKTFRQAVELLLRVWREAFSFFISIELWLMVLVAAAMVGGAWLAVMGSAWSLLAFGFASGYIGIRTVLHVKRILSWPFI